MKAVVPTLPSRTVTSPIATFGGGGPPLREYDPEMLGSKSAKLLMVLDWVKVSKSARGGTAYDIQMPPPTPPPSAPEPLVPKPPYPSIAVLPVRVLWQQSPPPPAATQTPPP